MSRNKSSGLAGAYQTEQESFWAGDFGDAYTERNQGAGWEASNTALFARLLRSAQGVRSVVEFGANRGLNIVALQTLLPEAKFCAVEINEGAVAELRKLAGVNVIHASLLDVKISDRCDLSLVKGVLIHLNPDRLNAAYEVLYRSSNRYICIAEYYSPSPVEISYRGHSGKLFKRDFAGEMLDRFPDLRLVDYEFVYRRDPQFPQDDITWFLLEKAALPPGHPETVVAE